MVEADRPRLGVNLLGPTLADLLPHPFAPAFLALPRLPGPGQAAPSHPLAVPGTGVPRGSLAAAARLGARATTLVATALLLTWPALWNGYPLIFADTGTYLGQTQLGYLGWDRPPFYSVFLFATHWRATLWGPVLAQGLILAHLLMLMLQVLGRPERRWLLLLAGGLALLTGLPWVAAQLMPDVFTGVVVLALWLLGFRAAALSVRERLWLMLLGIGAIAVHQSHVPLALGLAGLGGAVIWAVQGRRRALPAFGRMAVPAVFAAVAMMLVNQAGHARLGLSPFGSVFLATRLIYDGPGLDRLRALCPDPAWRICPVLDRLPTYHNGFLWNPDSPLNVELGGPKAWAAEASALVVETLLRDPGGVALTALDNLVLQLRSFDSGDGLEPWLNGPGPAALIARFFPREAGLLAASRQQAGEARPVAEWLSWFYRRLALLGLLALPVVCLLRRRTLDLAALGLALFVLAALVGNAAITGVLSGPAHRYQARLMWLAFPVPVVLAMAVPLRAGRRNAKREAGAGTGSALSPGRFAASQSTRAWRYLGGGRDARFRLVRPRTIVLRYGAAARAGHAGTINRSAGPAPAPAAAPAASAGWAAPRRPASAPRRGSRRPRPSSRCRRRSAPPSPARSPWC